jgi:2-hydroxychromene-2-carboxylate isomerase
MTKTLEVLFDLASPNVYFAWRALPPLLARTGAKLIVTPVLLGGIFKLAGNQSPMAAFANVKGKSAYDMLEIRRFIEKHALTAFRWNPAFPMNTLLAMRALIGAERMGVAASAREALLAAMWEQEKNLADKDVLKSVLDAAGLDGAAILALTDDPSVKEALAADTTRAVERGAFGLPTFFIGEEMFFGKERLGQIEDMLGM